MSESELRVDTAVIIVGGGPTGLSLALGLARYGVRSIVLERNLEPASESRAVVIWPRTQEILRDWHALDALKNAGRFVTKMDVTNARNEQPLIAIDWSVVDDVVDTPGALLLPQHVTESVLRELVGAHELCDLRLGTTVSAVAQDDRSVEVTYTASDGQHSIRGHYAVGCDGAHGIVRHALGLSLEGMTYATRIVLSDEVLDCDFEETMTARVRLDRPGLRAAIRFAPRTWRVITSVSKAGEDETILSDEAHRARLKELFGETNTQTIWRSIFKIHRRHAQRFLLGRVALAGDAAHLNSPAGGQGMNAGIQDAANLAWKVAYAFSGSGDGRELMETYDIERREMVTDTVERYTDRLTRVGITLPSRAKQLVVRGLSRAIRGAGMQRKACRSAGMLSGRYTKSPIIDPRHPLAGRRVDDLRLRDGKRVNEHRAGDAMIIVVGNFDIDLPHVNVPVPPKRWHIKPPVVLIVRPDACVAAVIEKPTREKVEAAWNKAFCGTLPLPSVYSTRSSIETL